MDGLFLYIYEHIIISFIGDEMKFKFRLLLLVGILVCSILLPFHTIKAIRTKYCLANRVIVIDPGHGGFDDGAVIKGICEDEINLAISSYLFEILISCGAQVYLTRSGDYDLASAHAENRKKEDLRNRVEFTNNCKASAFISIHLNSFPSSLVNGAQVFYYHDSTLAESIQTSLQKVNEKEKTIKKDDYYVLENINIPAALVECGFLSGNVDGQNLVTKEYQEELARLIFVGLVDYFDCSHE